MLYPERAGGGWSLFPGRIATVVFVQIRARNVVIGEIQEGRGDAGTEDMPRREGVANPPSATKTKKNEPVIKVEDGDGSASLVYRLGVGFFG